MVIRSSDAVLTCEHGSQGERVPFSMGRAERQCFCPSLRLPPNSRPFTQDAMARKTFLDTRCLKLHLCSVVQYSYSGEEEGKLCAGPHFSF
jgi:hypothetical protein